VPARLAPAASCGVTVLAAPGDAAAHAWARTLGAGGAPIDLVPLRHALAWTDDPQPGHAMVPAEALQMLMQQLRAGAPAGRVPLTAGTA
ncbi:MAG: hypothetical protein QM586_13755, partial [Xenophilus sp.]